MLKIKEQIKNIKDNSSSQRPITEYELKQQGLCNVVPHDYQLFGINWLLTSYGNKHGVLLGDEMGLGKTLQSIAFLLYVQSKGNKSKPSLVVTPLSVIDGWKKEFQRFSPNIRVKVYIGNREEREEIRNNIAASTNFDVLLTSYELCLRDESFFKKMVWDVLVVDEAHRLKNFNSQLYQMLLQLQLSFKVLLTGTPVQNNMKEIYSLLSFCNPSVFQHDYMEEFLQYFKNITEGTSKTTELHDLLKPFLLRRTKNEVVTNIPKKSEVMIYCGMSKIQKKLYKALLTKNLGAFNEEGLYKTSLMNILMQLRKCSNHPYIFPGIEAEPFMIGEHLVEASGKLNLLDRMLNHLHKRNHKVLLFSQMTTMLDIVQDYLSYRGYNYERLDGSVRGEERFLAVNNFNATQDAFIFLLSTKAGGQGLNLMSADTVIFLDNDFNPQNDLQAAARAHRIGQKRPVKIIRLVSKDTVEEIILKRAEVKLKLTQTVVEGGQFSNVKISSDNNELSDILKFGLENLLKDDESTYEDVDIEKILGKSQDGLWVIDDIEQPKSKKNEELEEKTKTDNIYEYEGEDYSKTTSSTGDQTVFDNLVQELGESIQLERTSRKNQATTNQHFALPNQTQRKRKVLTDEEKEELKIKREANKAKRMKMVEDEKRQRLLKLWSSSNYTSSKIVIPSDSESDNESESTRSNDGEDEEVSRNINYIVGDVTKPQQIGLTDAIVVHCVDDSGIWGSGGLFTAIDNHSKQPQEHYELSAKMKDLNTGDVHMVPMKSTNNPNQSIYVALLVAHTRNKRNQLSPLIFNALHEGLEKIYHVAKKTWASVHFPRIGYNTPNFNWYGTEKLIKKLLAQRDIPTYIYYFKRRTTKTSAFPSHASSSTSAPQNASSSVSGPELINANQSTSVPQITISSASTSGPQITHSLLTQSQKQPFEDRESVNEKEGALLDVFDNCVIYLHGYSDDINEEKRLSRYIIAYDGDVVNDAWSPDITHVIVKEGYKDELKELKNKNVKKLSSLWLDACIAKGVMVDGTQYEVS